MKTSIGKQFLRLIDLHFPKEHPLRKILNRNCLKISYCCTKNIKQIIQAHNNKLLQKTVESKENENKRLCNCRDKTKCPLLNKCKVGSIVYRSTVNVNNEEYTYVGSAQDFKTRYYNHKTSFVKDNHKSDTTLSNFVWDNELGNNPNIKWEVITKGFVYKRGQRYCDLCLSEAMHIASELKKSNCLNRNHELKTKCLHQWKHKLCNSV